jgi:hypothetical protein
LTRIALILHERRGNWARQLRPRLSDLPIRWFETRSTADLDAVLTGIAAPVVLIDLASRLVEGLLSLRMILRRASDARVLLLNPDLYPAAAVFARELGATHILSGFVPAPELASLLRRWVMLARSRIEHGGWSRVLNPDLESEPWSWLALYLTDRADASVTRNERLISRRPPVTQEPSPANPGIL